MRVVANCSFDSYSRSVAYETSNGIYGDINHFRNIVYSINIDFSGITSDQSCTFSITDAIVPELTSDKDLLSFSNAGQEIVVTIDGIPKNSSIFAAYSSIDLLTPTINGNTVNVKNNKLLEKTGTLQVVTTPAVDYAPGSVTINTKTSCVTGDSLIL